MKSTIPASGASADRWSSRGLTEASLIPQAHSHSSLTSGFSYTGDPVKVFLDHPPEIQPENWKKPRTD